MAEAQVAQPSADPLSTGTTATETGGKAAGSSAVTADVQANGATNGAVAAKSETSKNAQSTAESETSNTGLDRSEATKATEDDTSKGTEKGLNSKLGSTLKSTAESRDKRNGSYQSGRGGNKRDYNKRGGYRAGIKSVMDEQEPSSDPVAIRKQVEFYFSDSNLAQDRFLFGKVGGPANHAVPISVIHSFKRMRHFQPLQAVVDALKESITLEIVEDDTAIKRKEAMQLPADWEKLQDQNEIEKVFEDQGMARSVYAKGFGHEQASTQFDIEAWFAQYGPTNQVRLRRAEDKVFKGSVFVEFDSEETAKVFLNLDPIPKFNGRELQVKSKKQYCDEKVEDINSGRIRANERDHRKSRRDDRDWKERRDEFQKNGFKGERGGGRGGRNAYGGRKRGSPQGRDRHEYVPSAWLALDWIYVQCDKYLRLLSSRAKSSGTSTASPESSKKRARDEDASEEAEGSPKAKKTQVEASGKTTKDSAMRDEGVQTEPLNDEAVENEAAKDEATKPEVQEKTKSAEEPGSEANKAKTSETVDSEKDETTNGDVKKSAGEEPVPAIEKVEPVAKKTEA